MVLLSRERVCFVAESEGWQVRGEKGGGNGVIRNIAHSSLKLFHCGNGEGAGGSK